MLGSDPRSTPEGSKKCLKLGVPGGRPPPPCWALRGGGRSEEARSASVPLDAEHGCSAPPARPREPRSPDKKRVRRFVVTVSFFLFLFPFLFLYEYCFFDFLMDHCLSSHGLVRGALNLRPRKALAPPPAVSLGRLLPFSRRRFSPECRQGPNPEVPLDQRGLDVKETKGEKWARCHGGVGAVMLMARVPSLITSHYLGWAAARGSCGA